MLLLFSLSPIVVTIVGLLLRLRSVYAALLGVLTAVAVSIGYFPIQDWSGTSTWLVVMLEVLLIVGGGLLLAQALQTSGAQEQLSHLGASTHGLWCQRRVVGGAWCGAFCRIADRIWHRHHHRHPFAAAHGFGKAQSGCHRLIGFVCHSLGLYGAGDFGGRENVGFVV